MDCLTDADCNDTERCTLQNTCEVVQRGALCYSAAGECGACVQNCGNETNYVCGLFTSLTQPQCQISRASDGFGCGAGSGFKCCVISKPDRGVLFNPATGTCDQT